MVIFHSYVKLLEGKSYCFIVTGYVLKKTAGTTSQVEKEAKIQGYQLLAQRWHRCTEKKFRQSLCNPA